MFFEAGKKKLKSKCKFCHEYIYIYIYTYISVCLHIANLHVKFCFHQSFNFNLDFFIHIYRIRIFET